MTSIFPAQIDTPTTLPIVVDNRTPISATIINDLRSAIINIELTLGVNPARGYGTIANALITLETAINNLPVPIVFNGDLVGTPTNQRVIGIQGLPISSMLPVPGQVLGWNGTVWQPQFVNLTNTYNTILSGPGNFMEVGETLMNPIFSASYSSPPQVTTFVDNQGNPPINVFSAPFPSIPPGLFMYPTIATGGYKFSSYPATPFSVIFTLTSNASGSGPFTSTYTIFWVQRIYYGVGAPGQTSASFIQSLSNNPLSNTKTVQFTAAAGPGQAIYFAYRSAYGLADFWADGWEGGFNLVATVPITNVNGFTENYYLYQSSQTNLGLTTVYVF